MALSRAVVGNQLLLSIALLLTTGCGGGSNGSQQQVSTSAPCTSLASNLPIDQGVNLPGCLAGGCSTGFAVNDLVLDSSNVYWFGFDSTKGATGGSINSVPKGGGSVTTVVSGIQGVNDFVVDSTNVYWTEYDVVSGNGAIKTVAKIGGPVTVLATGTPPGLNGDVFDPGAVAVDSTYVYWMDINSTLRRVPKTGGAAVETSVDGFGAQRMVFDAGFVYLYGITGGQTPATPRTVFRYPLSGGSVQVLATGSEMAVFGNVALDDTYFYGANWDGAPNGDVFEVPIGGGAPIFAVTNLNNPRNLAIDTNNIYYQGNITNPGPTGVHKVSKAGGTPTLYSNCVPIGGPQTPAPLLGGVDLVAVDETNVYVMGGPLGVQGSAGVGELAVFPK